LITGLTAFETQQENGVNIDVKATHLIVAKAARFAAAELIAPSKLITGENATRGDFNSIAGSISEVLSDARIDNGFTDPTDVSDSPAAIAGVPTSWWLADANQPAIELCYVQGHGRAPRLRSGVLGNGQYGFWYDCSMASGVAPVKRKSVQRNNA
jgi:endonuclease/exonuclease/phosphatase family metal-dependent hydrolase